MWLRKVDDNIAKEIIGWVGGILLYILALAGAIVYINQNQTVQASYYEEPSMSQQVENNQNNQQNENPNAGQWNDNLGNSESSQNTVIEPEEESQNNPSSTKPNATPDRDIVYEEFVTERIEEIEKQVSEDLLLTWTPITMNPSYSTSDFEIYKPQLAVAKTAQTIDGNNAITKGEPIVYLIQVKNTGSEDLKGINVSDIVPNKTKLIEDSIFGGGIYNKNINKINWKLDIKSEEIVSVGFAVLADENTEGTITNTGVINGKETNTVSNPIIKTSKTVQIYRNNKEIQGKPVNEGDHIKYIITAENTGDVPAIVNIKDTIPENTKLISDIILAEKIIDEATMIAGKNIEIPSKSMATLTFTVEVLNAEAPIKNVATVDETKPEVEIGTAKLELKENISATIEEASEAEIVLGVNEKAYIKIELKNTGTEKLVLNVTDTINDKKIDIYENDKKITKPIVLEVGETKELTTTYTITQKDIDSQAPIINKIKVIEVNGIIPEKEEESIITPEVSVPNIEIDKQTISVKAKGTKSEKEITENTRVRPGDIITYAISVKNTGNVTLYNVNVTDVLDVKYKNALIENSKGEVIEKIKTLAPNEEKTYKVQYEVTQTDLEKELPITNSATATDGTTTATSEADKKIEINPNITISGTKTWKDYENQENTRPESVTIEVLNGNKVVDTIKVNEKDAWKYNSKPLQKYDENGKEIEYTVREKTVKGYTTEVQGTDIINTLATVPTKTVSGSKTWKDYENQEKTRPDSITIEVLKGNDIVDTIEVKKSEGWKYTSKELIKYDENNQEIEYTVREKEVSGYTTEVQGTDIINTLATVPTKTVSGSKKWKDYDNQEKTRPESITIEVLRGNKIVDTIEVKASEGWKYTSKELTKYDENNQEIEYTVREKEIKDYTTEVQGTDIINTLTTVPTITVSGTKTWKDYENQENTRPDSITVEILEGNTVVDTVKAKASEGWKYTSKKLPKYDENNNIINYTIRETVAGYTSENAKPVTDSKGNITIDITNKLDKVPTITLYGKLNWEDANNQDGIRPENVTITVISSDTKDNTERNVTIGKTPSNTYNWNYTINDLPKYGENYEKINYTVIATGIDTNSYATEPEQTVRDKTTGNITANITSKHEIETISVSGTKSWLQDNNNLNGTRPNEIIIKLMNGSTQVTNAQGNKIQTTVTPDKNGIWKYEFTDLPKNKNGNPIDYSIKELTVQGYTSENASPVRDSKGNITIDLTNTYIPPVLTKVKNSSAGTTIKPNEIITYTLETENKGTTLAKSVIITDIIPDFTTLNEGSITNNGILGQDGKTITWRVGDLSVGEKATVSFSVTVNSTAEAIGKNIVNTGKINGEDTNTVASKVVQYVAVSEVIYPIQNVDIVLVLDISDSMNANSRLTNMKKAAKDFISGIFPEGASSTGSTVSVVKFSETASSVGTKATNATTAATLKEKIDQLTATGGTNIEAALSYTNGVLDKLSNKNKFVLFLGDGAPTPNFVISESYGKESYITSPTSYSKNTEANITTQANAIKSKTTGVYSIGFGVTDLLDEREYWSHYIACTKTNCSDSKHIVVEGSTNKGKAYHWESAKAYATRVLRDIIADPYEAATATTPERIYYYEATDSNSDSIVTQFMTVLQEISKRLSTSQANAVTLKIDADEKIDITKPIKITINNTTETCYINELPKYGLSFIETAEEKYFTWDLTDYPTSVLKLEYTVNLL